MTANQPNEKPGKADSNTSKPELTDAEKAQLSSEETQEKHWKAFMAQLRKRQCPGCGESELF